MTVNLPGYQIHEAIFKSVQTHIYKGIRLSDRLPVVIKLPSTDHPGQAELANFRHEFEILQRLSVQGVIAAIALEVLPNSLALVLESFDGKPLSELLTSAGLQLPTFFVLAEKLISIVGRIHHAGVVHKDINLRNFLYNTATGDVRLIDFGLSSFLPYQDMEPVEPGLLVGSLPYMSPEQTGRMNQGIDYRTDYYSLGVVLYELIAGKRPFQATDAIGWVHSHIARQPESLCKLRGDVPPALDQVIGKLLAKKAQARYHSIRGLLTDLAKCREQVTSGQFTVFEPGEGDFCGTFSIPQKLYGREQETALLEQSFKRVAAGGCEMLMVAGYSGIGKSSLINEIHKPLVEKYGLFISGKFDQFKRHIPYSAICAAFARLLKQILMSAPHELKDWVARLQQALGPNGQVIVDVIPVLEKIIGKQAPVPNLGTEENQNRFSMVFMKFLRVFIRQDSPLVIFLDDLQWADIATLNLLKTMILSEGNNYLMLMGAYRDNEVDHSHPLLLLLDELRKCGISIQQLTLKPLLFNQVNQLVADTLHCPFDDSLLLAQLIFDKTQGNPFFVIQFLKHLYSDKLLSYDEHARRWCWNFDEIAAKAISDNVVDLMVKKLNTLPEQTRELLKLGACIGNSFDLATLAVIAECGASEVARGLWPALELGMLLSQGDNHRCLKNTDITTAPSEEIEVIDRFLHDRVQQAAYSLIADDQKQVTHLKIARLLLKSEQQTTEQLFAIVEHYNKSLSLIDQAQEQLTLAKLNLEAGLRAQRSTAYAPALEYYSVGLSLLNEQTRQQQQLLLFQLSKGLTECLFLTGKTDEGIQHAYALLEQCHSREQRVEINNILILHYGGAGQMDKSIDIAVDSLKLYHEHVPRHCNQPQLLLELLSTKLHELGKDAQHLKTMPRTQNQNVLSVLSLLKEMVAPCYLQGLLLLPYVILRMFKLTLKHGNSDISMFVFSCYGLLWSKLGLPSAAYKYGKLALESCQYVQNPPMEARTYFNVSSFCLFWQQPLAEIREIRRQGLQKLINSGENFWASYIYLFGFWQEVLLSPSIADVIKLAEREARFAHKVKQIEPFHVHSMHQGLFMCLAGQTTATNSLDFVGFNEQQSEAFFDANKTSTCGTFYHATTRVVMCYLNEDYAAAVAAATASKVTKEVIADPTFNLAIYTFFTCLAIIAWQPAMPTAQKNYYQKILNAGMRKLERWRAGCPENFECMLSLCKAEQFRVQKQYHLATEAYQQALQAAERLASPLLLALCQERCGRCWLEQQQVNAAQTYLQRAYVLYQQWGAVAKTASLLQHHPELLANRTQSVDSVQQVNRSTSISSHNDLDMSSVLKASQAISSEIVLKKLLEKLMSIVIENAGAQRGALILLRNNELRVEAEGDVNKEQIRVLEGIALDQVKLSLPVALIRYVARTGEIVLSNDVSKIEEWTQDAYFAHAQPKSMLLQPIVSYGKLLGILFLENQLVENLFTEERLALLKVLAAQVAVSVENALFYEELEQKVALRTAELESALKDLQRSQQHLIESEKMAALGQLIAGISHEVNTPLGAIKSSIGNINESLNATFVQLPLLLQQLDPALQKTFMQLISVLNSNVQTLTTREERQIRKVLEDELSSHQVSNGRQLAQTFIKLGIYQNVTPYLSLLKHPQVSLIFDTAYKLSDLQSNTRNIALATERATKIIFALKNFAHFDQSGEMIQSYLKDGLNTVLTIYYNQIKRGVNLITEFEELPMIYCFPDQLNQVWTNLIYNALQAMQFKGTLTIRLKALEPYQVVEISDTGCGIGEEIREKIFTPFFTTKKAGEGSGLGLDIVKRTIDEHQGKIEVTSEVGKGSTFTVYIPALGQKPSGVAV